MDGSERCAIHAAAIVKSLSIRSLSIVGSVIISVFVLSCSVREVVAATHVLVVDGGLLGLGVERRLASRARAAASTRRCDTSARARRSSARTRSRRARRRTSWPGAGSRGTSESPARDAVGRRGSRRTARASPDRAVSAHDRMRDGVHSACCSMRARHVLAHRRMTIAPVTRVHRDAATAKLHVHHRRRRADPDFFAEVAMRHRVEPIAEARRGSRCSPSPSSTP